MKFNFRNFAVLLIALLSTQHLSAQHSHLETGAVSDQEGSQLIFINGDDFAAEHGFVLPLTLITGENVTDATEPYLGYYAGNISFTVRAATLEHAGPEANHPAPGTEVYVEMLSVEGPEGGTFGFWEDEATEPTFEITPGSTETFEWYLSQNNGVPGSDPYGHVHDRQFTASSPGIYTVTFRLYDHSTNGTGGGPLHQPSDELQIRFLAGDGIPVTMQETGDFVIDLELHESALEANLREDDGHTDHVHDPIDPEKNEFIVSAEQRSHVGEHESYLGEMGSPVWKLHAREVADDDHVHETSLSAAHDDHEHSAEQVWEGTSNPLLDIDIIKDVAKGWNIFINTEGYTYSPENVSGAHIPGEGHAHIYVDGVKLGRVYTPAYYLGPLSPGTHTIRITLNANTHAEYTFEDQIVEYVEMIEQPDESGHSHPHDPREWDGAETPHLTLNVQPDPAAGWNLFFEAHHFTFAPEHASSDHVPGEGHAHIYINDEKLTRLYGNAYHLADLPAGEVEIRVSLSANDHAEYTLSSVPIEASVMIQNGEGHEHIAAPTLTFSAELLGLETLLNNEVAVSLASVSGPGSVTLLKPEAEHSMHMEASAESPVLASSVDGIDGADTFHIAAGELLPVIWAFSAPGNYTVELSASGLLALESSEVGDSISLLFKVLPSDKLEHAFMNGTLYLTWDEEQQLQHADSLGSAFEPVIDAHGSLIIDPINGAGFFRLEGAALH